MEEFVSTGSLPPSNRVQDLVDETLARFRTDDRGTVSTVYPALAVVPPDRFGVALGSASGALYTAGDARTEFTIMSVAKPFVFALVCEALGPDVVRNRVGVNATGLSFNSLAAVEAGAGRTNPMVNAGALATAGLVPGASSDERGERVLDGLSRFAGRALALDEELYRCAAATNHRNQALAQLLHAVGALDADPDETVDLYTRQSCVAVTAVDLALMGATLADGGVEPATGDRVVGRAVCRAVLAAMATAGLYETSGDWLHDVGLPGKSGIAGGMVTVSPGKGALGTFAPRLDPAGNSVRGQYAAAFLSRSLGLDLFASDPAAR